MITLPGIGGSSSAIRRLASLQGLVLGTINGTLNTNYNEEPACVLYYKDGKDSLGNTIGDAPIRPRDTPGIIGAVAGVLNDINPFSRAARQNENTPRALQNAVVMGISRNPTAEVMQHPIEDGSSFVDHRVVQPEELVVRFIFPSAHYRDLYSELQNASKLNRLFTAYTRSGMLTNLVLVSYPHEEDPEQYDVLAVEITFRETIFVTPSQGTMSSQNQRSVIDANTVQQGQKGPRIVGINGDAREQFKNIGLQGWGK